MTKPKMLTIEEAAQIVDGLSKFRIRQMCINGELQHMKAGKKYLINQNKLLSQMAKNPNKSEFYGISLLTNN